MEQEIKIRYINRKYGIGLVSWREAYLLFPVVERLEVACYKGNLVYRARGSATRFYYKAVKAGLEPASLVIRVQWPDWFRDIPGRQ